MDLCENFFGINSGAELPVIEMHNVNMTKYYEFTLSNATEVYTPTNNLLGYYILHPIAFPYLPVLQFVHFNLPF